MFENQYLTMNIKLIFLIGFMGSGKSTIGKMLAQRLNYDFIDSDLWIENEQGKNITSIFTEKGESYFRELEINFLENLKPKTSTVIATGGGLPCYQQNMNSLNELGTVFYLNASPTELVNRIKHDNSRPLLTNISEAEKLVHIQNKLKERSVFYERAHFTIDANKSIEEQISQIQCLLS